MANWYVDSSATGTNSGDSAANAAVDITLLSFGGNSFGPMPGDRVWVRRTHTMPSSTVIGRSGWNATSMGFFDVVGWPSSGDEFYDLRPGDARSLGWDTDGSQYANIPYPTITQSRGTTPLAFLGNGRRGFRLTNFAVVASNALSNVIARPSIGINLSKLIFLNCRVDGISADEVTFVTSYSGAALIAGGCSVGKVTLASSCLLTGAVFEQVQWCGELVNNCSSIAALHDRFSAALAANIGFVRGNETNIAAGLDGADSANTRYTPVHIEDYFGAGPVRLGHAGGGWRISAVSSTTASYSGVNSAGARATGFAVMSGAANAERQPEIWQNAQFAGHAVQYLAVLSGVPYSARWPVYITNAACIDPFRVGGFQFRGAASGFVRASIADGTIIPGTPARWQGSSIGAGSAYLMVGSFQPTETGTVSIGGYMQPMFVSQSVQIFAAPFFEVATT